MGLFYVGEYFLIQINKFGFVRLDLIVKRQVDRLKELRGKNQIYFHEISIDESSITNITEKVRIVVNHDEVMKSDYLKDQIWSQAPDYDGDECFFRGTMKLHLFSVTRKDTGIRNSINNIIRIMKKR